MDKWVRLSKSPVSLHISFGTTYTNNLTADDVRVRTSPTLKLFLSLDKNLRVRNKQSHTYYDAEELASGGLNELAMVQLFGDTVMKRLEKVLRTLDKLPQEWLLTISLSGERTFTVRPQPDQDRGSLFLHVLRSKLDNEDGR